MQLPSDITVQSWDAAIVAHVLQRVDPSFDFKAMFLLMDAPFFELSSSDSLAFLLAVSEVLCPGIFQSLLGRSWKYPRTGEWRELRAEKRFILLRAFVEKPEALQASPRVEILVGVMELCQESQFPSLTIPESCEVWTYKPAFDALLTLLDSPLYNEAKLLLQPALQSSKPFMLLLFLTPPFPYMKQFLIEQLCDSVILEPLNGSLLTTLRARFDANQEMLGKLVELIIVNRKQVSNQILINLNLLGLQSFLLHVGVSRG